MKHLKWEKTGRLFDRSDEGEPNRFVFSTSVGQQNVDLGGGKFAPYVWEPASRTVKFADCELRFTGTGLEVWRESTKQLTLSFHPEYKQGPNWKRRTSSVGSLSVQEIDPGNCKVELKLSYKVNTQDSETEVFIRAGYNHKVIFGTKFKSLVAGTEQRIGIEFDSLFTPLQEIDPITKNLLPVTKLVKGNTQWSWALGEQADHELEQITVTKVHLGRKVYALNEEKIISPDTYHGHIAANADDGNEFGGSGGTWYANGVASNSEITGWDGSNNDNAGFRFTGIAASGTINTCTITTYTNNQSGSTCSVTVQAVDETNAAVFNTSGRRPSTVTRTTANPNSGTLYTTGAHTSADLSAIVTELLASYGASGITEINFCYMGIGSGGYVYLEDYNNAGTAEAYLDITYTPAPSGSVKVISETVRIVDGLGRRNRSIRILNETERIIEALVRNLRSVKRVNETEQISEGIIRKGWVKKMVNETLQVAEMIVRRLRSIKIRNETINIVEGLVRKLRSTKIINQTVNLVVVATSILKKYVWTIPENLTLIENIIKKTMTISGVVIRFGNDTINLVEVAGRRLRSIRIKSETVNIVEGLIRRNRLIRAIGETVNLVEGLIRKNRVVRLVSEILNIIEGKVTKTFTQTKKIVSDTINIIESTARRLTIIKIVSEVERIVEGIVRRGWAVKIKGETINLIEGMIRRSRAVRIASEVVQIVESLIRRSRVLWRIAETVQIVEGKVTKTFTQLVKLVTDKVNLIEGTVRKTYSQVAKVISETVRLMEVIVKRPRIVKIITDVERLIEGSVRRMWARPIVNETVRIVENISRRMWTRKIINETVRIVEGVYNWTSGKVESWFKFFRANRSHVVFEADGLSLNFKAIKKFLRFRAE